MLDRGPFTNQYKNEFSLKSLIDKLSFKIFDADAKITVLFRGKEMMRFYKATDDMSLTLIFNVLYLCNLMTLVFY